MTRSGDRSRGSQPKDEAARAAQVRSEATRRVDAEALAERGPADSSPGSYEQVLQELRVHQIELEMQNEELRRARLELDAARARWFDLYDLAPVGYCTVSEKGLISESNLTLAALLGVVRGALVRRPFSQFVFGAHQDAYYLLRKQVFADGNAQSCDLRMTRAGEPPWWARLTATKAADPEGLPELRVAVTDITARIHGEEALRQSDEAKSKAQAMSHVGSWQLRQATNALSASDELLRILGLSRDEASLEACASVVHPDDVAGVMATLQEGMEHGVRYEIEHRLLLRDGKVKWVHSIGEPVVDDAGTVETLFGTTQDITERKQAEAQLRAAENEFRALAEAMPQIVWVTRPDGWNIYFNRQWTDYTGLTMEESHGHGWNAPFHPDDRQRAWEAWQRAVQFGDEYSLECRLRRADGVYRWWLVRGVPFRDEQGNILKWFGTCTDIEDIKRVAEAQRESQAKLAAALDSMSDAVFVSDLDGNFIDFNDAFATFHRFANKAECAKSLSEYPDLIDVFMADGEPAPLEMWAVPRALRGETVTNAEYGLRRKDTGERWVGSYSFGPIRNETGGIVGSVVVGRDITQVKQAEQERRHLEAELAQARKMESVGLLAGGVAHDFNNMLGVILGSAELAITQVDQAHPLHEDLLEIRRAASRSANLTRQLLAFARQQTIAPVVLDLNENVAGMLSMLQRLMGEDISLHWQPAAVLWPVMMDPSQMDQILANLCANARHAIASVGTVTIATANVVADAAFCAAHAEALPGGYVRLSVRDTGCGMDEATLNRIFEPFFSTKGVGEGTGLGLATVYGAVKQNQGFVSVSSTLGAGTLFEIFLPRHYGASTSALPPGQAAPDLRGHETILLVEDEPALMHLVKRTLETLGYSVLAASGAADALRLATTHAGEIHLLLTDVVMPELNGRELASAALQIRPTLKTVFMSGYTADVLAIRGPIAPGVAFIEKPFSSVDLAAKIRLVLDGAQAVAGS